MRYLLVLLLLTGCSSTAAPTATPSPEAPITVQSTGGAKSEPFTLQGGAYAVQWTVNTTRSCLFLTGLDAVEGRFTSPITNLTITTMQQGQSTVTKVPAGRYVIDTVTYCDSWSFTISPTS